LNGLNVLNDILLTGTTGTIGTEQSDGTIRTADATARNQTDVNQWRFIVIPTNELFSPLLPSPDGCC
jgi:hypothetical protein